MSVQLALVTIILNNVTTAYSFLASEPNVLIILV